jgi:hypothetical protein
MRRSGVRISSQAPIRALFVPPYANALLKLLFKSQSIGQKDDRDARVVAPTMEADQDAIGCATLPASALPAQDPMASERSLPGRWLATSYRHLRKAKHR